MARKGLAACERFNAFNCSFTFKQSQLPHKRDITVKEYQALVHAKVKVKTKKKKTKSCPNFSSCHLITRNYTRIIALDRWWCGHRNILCQSVPDHTVGFMSHWLFDASSCVRFRARRYEAAIEQRCMTSFHTCLDDLNRQFLDVCQESMRSRCFERTYYFTSRWNFVCIRM